MSKEIVVPEGLSELDKTIFLVRFTDRVVSKARELVYRTFADKLWEGRFPSFQDFVESQEGLNKSQAWASKQIRIHERFTIEGEIPLEELECDSEKLYLATQTSGTPEEQLERAKLLTRSELNSEIREKKNGGPCFHSGEKFTLWRKYDECSEWVKHDENEYEKL